MPPYRILAMDGGEGFITTAVLGSIHSLLPSNLLDDVAVFAGTSGGGINALLFASCANPDDRLALTTAFWQTAFDMISFRRASSVCRSIGAAAGNNALLSREPTRAFFSDFFGATTRLGDLKHRVLIPAFQLDGENKGIRSWKPKIYHNFRLDEPDLDELVVDVALRTSGVPVTYPIFQSTAGVGPGFIDGGAFANNPSMCALAQVIGPIYREAAPDDVLLLSTGNGLRPKYAAPRFVNSFADWGYRPWLLDTTDPLLLLEAVFQADSQVVDYECRSLLEDRYRRINPVLTSSRLVSGTNIAAITERVLALPNTQAQIRAAVDWLTSSGWIPAPAAAPPPPVVDTTVIVVETPVPPPSTEG